MASDVQKYDKTRNANAAGSGALSGAGAGIATGAGIGATAGAAGGPIGMLIGAGIGAAIGAATLGATGAGAGAWTDDAAQKQEIKVSEKNVASAERAEKEAAIDSQALARSAQRPGGGGGGGLPSGSSYLPAGGTTSYDTWKGRLQGGL
jgi:hypothetical protein